MISQLSPYFRKQEARNNQNACVMLSIVEDFDYQFVIAGAPSQVFFL
jgi:hypothetical protein